MENFSSIFKNNQPLKLIPITPRELLFLEEIPCHLYGPVNNLFEIIVFKGSLINREVVKNLLEQGMQSLYVEEVDFQLIQDIFQEKLRNLTRALSIDNSLEKSFKKMNLLLINYSYLYQNPTDDEILKLIFQCLKNLVTFLLEKNNGLSPNLYQYILRLKYHYSMAHPLLSSILLISFLKNLNCFNPKEIETLVLVNFFKDIGMSLIPFDKLNQKDLSENDRHLLSQHAQHSRLILDGRLPLNKNYLQLIENHHNHSLLIEPMGPSSLLFGAETFFIDAIDTLTAMISPRPYREGIHLFQTLELLRNRMAKEYNQEFKFLVSFTQKFFSK